jgi:chromosome partitioning protein
MLIAVINQKGGVGKSSTAVHFAEWLRVSGKSVVLIDTDIQRSSSTWAGFLDIPNISLTDPSDIADTLFSIGDKYEYVIIDGVGGLTDATRVILYYANLALIPCTASGLDLSSSTAAFKLVRQAREAREKHPGADMLIAATFLNRAVPNTALKKETKDALSRIDGIKHLDTVIHQRQCIADMFGQQETVFAKKKWKVSATEYTNLFKEVISL